MKPYAQKAIREADGKRMMARLLKEYTNGNILLKINLSQLDQTQILKNYPHL